MADKRTTCLLYTSLAYNKDLQEDKGGMLDSARTLSQSLAVMAGMISPCTFNADVMRAACEVGHLAATDVADYLAKKGMPCLLYTSPGEQDLQVQLVSRLAV